MNDLFATLNPATRKIPWEAVEDWSRNGRKIFMQLGEAAIKEGALNDVKCLLIEVCHAALAGTISSVSAAACIKDLHLSSRSLFNTSLASNAAFYPGPLQNSDPLLIGSYVIDLLWILEFDHAKSFTPSISATDFNSNKSLGDIISPVGTNTLRKKVVELGCCLWVQNLTNK